MGGLQKYEQVNQFFLKNQYQMGMNVFRFAGDMSHLFSIIVLLLRLRVAKNAQGTSFFFYEMDIVPAVSFSPPT